MPAFVASKDTAESMAWTGVVDFLCTGVAETAMLRANTAKIVLFVNFILKIGGN